MCVCRFYPRKNLQLLLRTMAELQQSDLSFELRLVGNGAQMSHLRELARELHVKDSIVFAGDLTEQDLAKEYREAGLSSVFPAVRKDLESFCWKPWPRDCRLLLPPIQLFLKWCPTPNLSRKMILLRGGEPFSTLRTMQSCDGGSRGRASCEFVNSRLRMLQRSFLALSGLSQMARLS